MIPMRDGVKLNTRIYVTGDSGTALPFLMTRTPTASRDRAARLEAKGSYAELAREQYIFVYQDIRGRYGSEGQFVMNRPLHDPRDPKGVDESTDTYDTDRVAACQRPAATTARSACWASRIPAGSPPWPASIRIRPLKAISPQAPMTDTWMGDDFFHQGAFRLSYGFEYATDAGALQG